MSKETEIPKERIGMIDDLVKLGRKLVEKKQYDQAIDNFQKAYNICIDKKDDKNRLTLIWLVCDCFIKAGKFEEAEQGLAIGLDLARKQNDIGERIRLLEVMALSRSRQGNTAAALGPLQEALELCRTYRDRGGERYILERLAYAYLDADRKEQAIENFDKVIKLAKQANELPRQVAAMVSKAELLAGGDEDDLVKELFEEAEKICRDNGQIDWAEDVIAKKDASLKSKLD
jgi:tetratricopeptide (TPR) repeat protein